MHITSKSEAKRPAHASLVSHYRAIGPAAIAAALVCMRKPAKKAAKR